MSILNILIFILGGIAVAIYSFFAIKKYLKWKNRVKQLIANGHDLEVAKTTAYNEVYKKPKKNKKANNQDTPYVE